MPDREEINLKIDEVHQLELIAMALEKIASRPKRKSIGAVFGSIIDHAHKHAINGTQHPDEYSHELLNYLAETYPTARYPADITRLITPEVMIEVTTSVLASSASITGEPKYAAQILVWSLRDAGFWED